MLAQERLTDFHRNLILDEVRTNSYRRAIMESVQSGDVVCDIGAGTGILSVFAAQAGASRVYAIEGGPIASAAARVAHANGVADIVTVIHANSLGVSLPQKVDVVVSECIGWMMYIGEMFSAVIDARDRMLAPDGLVIPSRVTLFAAPVKSLAHYRYVECFRNGAIEGIDLSPLGQNVNAFITTIPASSLVAEPKEIAYAAVVDGYPSEAIDAHVEFEIVRGTKLHGITLWFDVELCEGVRFSCAPWESETIWQQTFIGCGPEIALSEGSTVRLRLQLWRSMCNFRQRLDWTIGVYPAGQEVPSIERDFSTLGAAPSNLSEWECKIDGEEWLQCMRSRFAQQLGGGSGWWQRLLGKRRHERQ